MFDSNPPDATRAVQPLPREGGWLPASVSRHRPFFFLVAVLIAQLLLLSFQITRNRNVRLIRVWAVAVLDPFERSLRSVQSASTQAWRTYHGLWHVEQENRELHLQLVAAQTRVQELSQQASESQRLRELLSFKGHLPFQTVAAEVIASSPGDNSNGIFIDKGSDAGLTEDLGVITPAGVVGKIITVFPRSSHVLLITDPSSGVGVTLAQSRVQGVMKGGDRSLCQILYVMNEEPVTRLDAVETSGLDQIFPKGLPVGSVLKVGDGNIYKRIVVKPAVDLSRLEAVLVVLRPGSGQQEASNVPTRP